MNKIETERDKKGNYYVVIDNVRITYVDKNTRQESKNWSSSDTIRFSAYKSAKNDSLHIGAEIPIKSRDEIINLIEGLCVLYKATSKVKLILLLILLNSFTILSHGQNKVEKYYYKNGMLQAEIPVSNDKKNGIQKN